MRFHFRRTVWGMHFKKLGYFPLKCGLSDLSQLIFRAKSWGQKLNAGLFLNQVDLIFTVSHPVCCLSSHRLNVGNWQVSNIDGQTLVDSETWNLPKISKSHMSVKSARKTGCFVKCPQPLIFTWDFKKSTTGENCPFDILTHEFLKFHHLALEPSFKYALHLC